MHYIVECATYSSARESQRSSLSVMLMARFIHFLLFISAINTAHAAQVTVAVASNFATAMRAIAAEFEQNTSHTVTLAYGSSGKFYAQIISGAPYHILLSADQSTAEALQQRGLVVQGSRFTYAVGALVLWSAIPGKVDNDGLVLTQQQFRRLAIANPKVAPYGAAAMEVLHHLGVDHNVKVKLVQGENIAQAYQFVATGNAELGFVALSQVIDNKTGIGSWWRVPSHMHRPIKQDAVLLTNGEHNPAARELMQFIRTPAAKAIIARYGYAADGAS